MGRGLRFIDDLRSELLTAHSIPVPQILFLFPYTNSNSNSNLWQPLRKTTFWHSCGFVTIGAGSSKLFSADRASPSG